MLWLGILISLSSLILGIVVIKSRKNSPTNLTFGIFAVGVGMWILSIFLAIHGLAPLFWGRLAFTASIVGMAGLFLFVVTFPNHDRIHPKYLFPIAIPALFFAVAFMTPFIIKEVTVVNGSLNGVFGPLMSAYKLFPPIYILGSIAVLLSKYSRTKGFEKLQLKYTQLGMAITVIPAMMTNAILPAVGIRSLNGLGPLFVISMVGFTSYAILKHRFLDIRIVIQRGLLYLIAVAMTTAIYFGLIFLAGEMLRQHYNSTHLASAIISAIAVVIGFPSLKKFFNKITDPFFFRGSYNYNRVMTDLEQAINSTIEPAKLSAATYDVIKRDLKIDKASVVLLNEDNTSYLTIDKELSIGRILEDKDFAASLVAFMQRRKEAVLYRELAAEAPAIFDKLKNTGVAILVPTFSRDKIVGLLFLGEKMSGEALTIEDINLLNILSKQIGVIIDNVKLYVEAKRYNQRLEQAVIERTQKLQNLYNAQARFLGDISHELQTPLSILKVDIGLLQEKNKDDESAMHALKVMDRNVDSMSQLIRDLLAMAKAEFGLLNNDKEPLELHSLLEELYEGFKMLAENKNIELRFSRTGDVNVLGNKEKLRELFFNILGNSLKYTPSGGKIKVSLYQDEGKAKIECEDTGLGIDREDLPHIFDRFYRSKKIIQEGWTGTGLGLAISKQIAEMHGGNISVESRPGKGSRFTVHLPVYQKTEQAEIRA